VARQPDKTSAETRRTWPGIIFAMVMSTI